MELASVPGGGAAVPHSDAAPSPTAIGIGQRASRFLIVDSETPAAQQERRDSVGCSSGETYADTLRAIVPAARADRIAPADLARELPGEDRIAGYDAVFLTGSAIHVYEDTPETRRQIALMRAIFASGTPAFGSCAGLQVAAVAAGGTVAPMRCREAGFARRISPADAGRGHPLLEGRPPAYDAITIHADEVVALPEGATLLASNAVTRVHAAEIRLGPGIFWGVQYHPELSLAEIAAALRRDADNVVENGLALSRDEVEAQADLIAALGLDPRRTDLAWRLGVDAEVVDDARRRLELRNFVDRLVLPTLSRRARA